jgi:lysophospholipase L1-like esterase
MDLTRVKNLLKNLALSLASLLIFISLVEITLRFMGYGQVEIYEPDPELYWKLKPSQNCFTKVDHKPVHINSQGTRGPEFEASKLANTVRIISLGDSRTFGWGLTESESYSGLLQKLLQERFGANKKVEVINAGVNAWSFAQMNVYFRTRALRYEPDFVIVGDANLWTQFSGKNSPEFVRKFMWRVRLKNILRRFALYHYFIEVKLKDFYERYRTRFIPVDPQHDRLFKEQQQKDPEAFFRSEIEELCRSALDHKVRPILLYLPILDELGTTNRSPIFKVKKESSQKLSVPLVDLTLDLEPKGKSLYLEADPVHLNAAGNEIIARRLFEAVTNSISP